MSDKEKGFGERLTLVIKRLDYTGNSFAKKIGQGNSKVYQIMRGDVSPSVKFCEKICESFPEINFDWLITGRGKPILYESDRTEEDNLNESLPEYPDYKELWETARELIAMKNEQIEHLKNENSQLRTQLEKKDKS